jgi:hypothetical protein
VPETAERQFFQLNGRGIVADHARVVHHTRPVEPTALLGQAVPELTTALPKADDHQTAPPLASDTDITESFSYDDWFGSGGTEPNDFSFY